MEKIKLIIKKVCTKEVIFYGIFGILTTILNISVSFILESKLKIDGAIASAVGIILAVIFAYFTNRKLVFNSTAQTFKEQLNEFKKFVLGRALTMVLEEGGVIIFYNLVGLPYLPVKVALTVIVVILNFFISKLFAFKQK